MSGATRHVATIAKRELSSYFSSPVAYVVIVIFLGMMGFFTFMLGGFFERNEASLVTFFQWHPWLYLVLVPALGMRLWSEERRTGTVELLFTMPVTTWQAVLGKFIASWIFLGIILVLTFPVVLTVNLLGAPDNRIIFCGYVGSLLLAGGYLAITCATSAMTRNQVISFIIAVVICLLLVLAGWPPVTSLLTRWFPNTVVDLVASFGVMTHFEGMQRGVLDSRDLVFFLSLIGFPLFVTGVILRGLRN